MLRIDKFWNQILPLPTLRKKDLKQDSLGISEVSEQASDQQPDEKRQKSKKEQKESIEKEIEALNTKDAFKQSGLQVEAVEDSDGFVVKVTQPNGTTVKTMSAEDFLKLRQNTQDPQSPRGKILDQKF